MTLRKYYTPEQMAKAIEAVRNGEKVAVAAQRFGVSRLLFMTKPLGKLKLTAPGGNHGINQNRRRYFDPSWASMNRGLLLCAECCSVHRSMGRHISHVKSLRQGSWPPSLLAMVQALTAQNVNSIWEHSLLDANAPKHLRRKPQPKDSLHPTKAEFILAKHLRLAYVLRARRDEPAAELGRQLHSAVRSANLDTSMRLLAQGADPDYFNQEKGTACLHVACRAGHAAQAELLVAWGADPTVRDANANTPADCARSGSHVELAERMVELVYELTDRLTYFLMSRRPDHVRGQHFLVPDITHSHEMTDMAKATRGKLQLLPNHLFEELVMDIYDEVDRRETEAVWQTSAVGLERCGVVFLPVNPALSAPRNQGRQKLARLSQSEMMSLIRDVLVDAQRRQHMAMLKPHGPANPLLSASHLRHMSQMSDDEPLYDSVASDEDYAALLPLRDIHMSGVVPKPGETVSPLYNPSVPNEQSSAVEARSGQSPSRSTVNRTDHNIELETLKRQLNNRDSTISELKNQLRSLQTIVEQLTRENSVLKTSVDDSQSVHSLSSTIKNDSSEATATDTSSKAAERGKSLESEQICCVKDEEFKQKSVQRPVSMYETREGPKNNWQVTKHQLTTLGGLERSSVAEAVVGCSEAAESELPSEESVQRHAELVTRGIQELWAAMQEPPAHPHAYTQHALNIQDAVHRLLAIFPQKSPGSVSSVLVELRAACEELVLACGAGAPLHRLRAAAYDLAKATKELVTHLGLPR